MGTRAKDRSFKNISIRIQCAALFFLLGYTFKYNVSLKAFLQKRFLKTMVPYYIWAIISITVFLFMGKYLSFNITNASMSLWKNLVGMLYANSRTIYMRWNHPLWFIPCMNLTLVMGWLIEYARHKFVTIKGEIVRMSACFVFALAGIIMKLLIDVKFPFQFESAVLMTAFLELGLILKERKTIEVVSCRKSSVLVCVTLLIVGILSAEVNGVAEVRSYNYGKYPVLFLTAACSMTVLIALISYKINSNLVFEYVGQISFPILLMHKFPILFFQSVMPITRTLLEKPDTVEGFLCSPIVTCITIGMCYVGTVIIRRIAPIIIGS